MFCRLGNIVLTIHSQLGYINKDMPAKKYPMHYLPEALFAILTVAGIMVVRDI